tara:strand:- start:1845 stop:2021 length:177 start_codon:yes stop_codon:yes gene_type:complete
MKNKLKIVYKIYDENGNFFQYIKASELVGAVRHFIKLNKQVTIEEDYIKPNLYKSLFV